MTTYKPEPIDTSTIEPSAELALLIERLAENAHDNWAKQRMSDGWTYGPQRNDQNKTHPALVPYEQLPDTEKCYDRNAGAETIKAILAMGYCITIK